MPPSHDPIRSPQKPPFAELSCPDPFRPPWQQRILAVLRSKIFWGCGLVAALGLLYWLGPLGILTDQERVTAWLQGLGPEAAVIFMGLYIVATVIGIPGTVLTLVGGILFGLVWGTLWSVMGATLGAIGAFWVARYWLHDWFACRFRRHPLLQRIHNWVMQDPFRVVLTIRFVPISPFNLENYLFGLSSIPLKPYIWGTLLGIIPGTLVYTWLGITGQQALGGEDPWPFVAALVSLGILSVLPFCFRGSKKSQDL